MPRLIALFLIAGCLTTLSYAQYAEDSPPPFEVWPRIRPEDGRWHRHSRRCESRAESAARLYAEWTRFRRAGRFRLAAREGRAGRRSRVPQVFGSHGLDLPRASYGGTSGLFR